MSTFSIWDIFAPRGLTAAAAISRALRGAAVSAALLLPLAGPAAAQAASGPAALCPAGTQAASLWTGDFEGGADGWAATRFKPAEPLAGGAAAGQLAGSHWHLSAPAPGGQPWRGLGNAWGDTFPGGIPTSEPSDSVLSMAAGVTLPAEARLTFVHRFNFEAGEGDTGGAGQVGAGVVEYSVDDGVTWSDVAPAGGSSLFAGAGAGGYNGRVRDDLPTENANPLAGRPAFAGRSSADLQYRSSHLDLSPLAGKRVRLRFRIATPGLPGAQPPAAGTLRGWAIDDVNFYRCEQKAPDDPVAPDGTSPLPVGADTATPRLSVAPFAITALRRPRILRPGTRDKLHVVATNASSRATRRVRVCFQAPRRLLGGSRCVLVKRLPGGATAEIAFPVKVLRTAAKRNWIRVGFVARVGGATVAKGARRYRVGSPPKSS